MSYLKFDKTRMVNLEYSLKREILRTNRRGSYHYTTLVECNTRKQHGLLAMPIPALDDSNHILLSSFDETVIQHGAEFNLGIHKYNDEHYSPMGHKYIREFDCDSCPKTLYRVGGVVLSKEKMFSLKDNNIMIRYTLLDAHSPTTLRFRPFLAFREINSLTIENNRASKDFQEVENGISTCMYEGYPDLFMQFNKKVKFVFDPHWNKGIEYLEDMEEGFHYKEDLYVPGYFELSIKKGETIVFVAGDKKATTRSLIKNFEEGFKERTPRSSFYNCLRNSGHQFYFRPSGKELYLLEGYPWFKVNVRAQFYSLPGLTLYLGRDYAFEEVMDSTEPSLRQLMQGLPIENRHLAENIDAPDTLLWAVWALGKYAKKHKEKCYEKYGSLVFDIIDYYKKGNHPKLNILDNGLIYVYGKKCAVTGVNNINIHGTSIVPRTGCLVEVNALWYNALMFALDIAKSQKNTKQEKHLHQLAQKVKESFNSTFVNDGGYLYDYVDGNYVNWSVRPNMLLAIAIDYSPLDRKIAKSIFDIVTKELLTPKGIRSLSPKSEGYSPYYQGDKGQKKYSTLHGMASPNLLEEYVEAGLKIMQRAGLFYLEHVITGLEEEMANGCIGSLSQFYDGNPPYSGHGAGSYAPHVAGMLGVFNLLNSYNDEIE